MSESKLTLHQKQILQLIKRSERLDGFAIANEVTWPLIAPMPNELVEKWPQEFKCRLTETAKIILTYL